MKMETSRWNKGLKKILVSKRLWCLNRSSLGTHKGMKRAVNEHGSMGATGEGGGSGSESRRIEPRQKVAIEGRGFARDENVSQGSNVKGSGVGESVPQGSNGKGSDACDVPQGSTVKGSEVCERFYIGDVLLWFQNKWEMLWIPSGAKLSSVKLSKKLSGLAGYDVSALGLQPGSKSSTPQKVHVGQRGNVDVEMDPVELFRLRCLRENYEKFRKVCWICGRVSKSQGLKKHGTEKGSYGSQSSYASEMAFQEPGLPKFHDVVESWTVPEPNVGTEPIVPTVFEPFVPKPPPGPPPPSPPRLLTSGYGLGSVTPPVPLCRSKGKWTWRKNPSNVDHQLCDISKGKWSWRKQFWDGLGWKPWKRWMGSPDLWKSKRFLGQ